MIQVNYNQQEGYYYQDPKDRWYSANCTEPVVPPTPHPADPHTQVLYPCERPVLFVTPQGNGHQVPTPSFPTGGTQVLKPSPEKAKVSGALRKLQT
mmetsp:Transcript_17064/g.30450  ORF Transcript_17064/g.30450 Transcript_17064/m.30450 type:complete len:96 (+) Transcript_17064:143-430(+)